MNRNVIICLLIITSATTNNAASRIGRQLMYRTSRPRLTVIMPRTQLPVRSFIHHSNSGHLMNATKGLFLGGSATCAGLLTGSGGFALLSGLGASYYCGGPLGTLTYVTALSSCAAYGEKIRNDDNSR